MNEDGTTAATGFLLMVLLTVILAAVIAYFVFGLAGNISAIHNTQSTEKTIHVTGKDVRGGIYYIEDNNCEWYRINARSSLSYYDIELFNELKCGNTYTVIINNYGEIQAIGCNSDCER